MLSFLLHFRSLFFQLLNFDLSWSNVSFKFFDFVIKHKFEFLKLLCFLLKLINSCFFVFNGLLSLFNIIFMSFNFLLISRCMREFYWKKIVNFFKLSRKLILLSLCFLEFSVSDCKLSFWVQTLFCNFVELLFILLFNFINLVPF